MKTIKNKGLAILSLVVLALTIVVSCKKGYDYNLPPDSVSVAEFSQVTNGTTYAGYFVKATNDPLPLVVGFTNTSNVDRTINFTVTSRTAVAGTQYIAPSAVVVKAGQSFDTLKFKALFAGYPSGRKDTVTIKMSGFPTVNNTDSIRVVIQPYCDVTSTNMTGNYTASRDYWPAITTANASATAYTAVVSDWTSTGATTATAKIKNLGNTPDIGFAPFAVTDGAATGLTAIFDWTDPANFKVSIASQPYVASLYTYGASTISTVSGSFSSCDQTITLSYSVRVSAGSFNNQHSVLRR
jgi:hypothetical protein